MSKITVKDKLRQIQKDSKEPELFPYLKKLFEKKGFQNVEITHGNSEYGKDLVFSKYDKDYQEERWYCSVVKNRDAKQSDFESGGEVLRQIETAFKTPYINSKGQEKFIGTVYVIINGAITFNAKSIIKTQLHPSFVSNIIIWNYQNLEKEFSTNIRLEFIGQYDIELNTFKENQIIKLSRLQNSDKLFQGLNIEDINDIFVNVNTSYRKKLNEINSYKNFDLKAEKIKKNKHTELDDAIDILNSPNDFIIYGIPTSGKTLLLKRIGYHALTSQKDVLDAVFFIELGNYNGKIEKFNIEEIYKNQYFEFTDGEILEREKFDRLIILFDGLDELIQDSDKIIILQKIHEYRKEASRNEDKKIKLILSTRTTDIIDKSNLLNDFEQVELLPFNIGQALNLVKKIIPNNHKKSNAFVEAIKESILKDSLTRTPLALTLMAILYRDDEIDLMELPANITELFNKFTDYYLNRWDSSKGLTLQYKYEEAKQILAFIALKMHKDEINQISVTELSEFLNDLKNKYDYEDLKDINQFIKSLKERIGLVYYDNKLDIFRFYNFCFQEYFSSISIDDSNEDILLNRFFVEFWENTIVFYCGKQPKREIFLGKVKDKIIPVDLKNQYQYLVILSKCLQASHLISRNAKNEYIIKLVIAFDKFYKSIISEGKEGKGLAPLRSTLDLILEFRDFFNKIFSSKHLNNVDFEDNIISLFEKHKNEFSDVTLYSMMHFLSFKNQEPFYLEEFISVDDLNPRWSRIIYIDINLLHLKKKVNEKLFRKIKKKQARNREYILEQFNQSSLLHLK